MSEEDIQQPIAQEGLPEGTPEVASVSLTLDRVLGNIDEINATVVRTFDAIREAASANEKTLMDELGKIKCDPNIRVYLRLVAEATKKTAELEKLIGEAEAAMEDPDYSLTDAAGMIVAIRYAREDLTELVERCNNFFTQVIVEYAEQDLDVVIQKIRKIGSLSTQQE